MIRIGGKHPGCLLLAVACASALGIPAGRADEDPPDPDFSLRHTRRAGPFHYRPFLEFRDVGYDDNVLFDPEDPEGDAMATLSGGLAGILRTGRAGGLYLSQEFDYVTFARLEELNHWNRNGRIKGAFWPRKLLMTLEEQSASSEGRPNYEVDRRLRRRERILAGSLRTLSSGRLGLDLRVRRWRVEFPAEDPEAMEVGRQLNREEDSIALAGRLRVLPKTTLVLESLVESADFPERLDGGKVRSFSLLPGVRFDPAAAIRGEIRAGRRDLDVPGRPEQGYRGVVGYADLGARLGPAARVRASFLRDVAFSTVEGNLYYLQRSWSGSFEQFFNRQTSVEILYRGGRHDYPEPVSREGEDPFQGLRQDRLRDVGLVFRYRRGERLTFSVGAFRQDRDSNDDFFDVDRNLFVIGSRLEI